jgi:hypothetical protein
MGISRWYGIVHWYRILVSSLLAHDLNVLSAQCIKLMLVRLKKGKDLLSP